MKNTLLLLSFLAIFIVGALAQNDASINRKYHLVSKSNLSNIPKEVEYASHNRCATVEKINELIQQDPSFLIKRQEIETKMQEWITVHQSEKTASVITIPVVIHIVYNTSTQNVSDAQIQSQIDVLNEDYRKLNSDFSSNVPSAFQSLAGDAQIEFCLANIDENGNATTGITRTQTSKTSFSTNDDMKYSSKGGEDGWDAKSYLNIWVCKLSGGLLGYAYPPGVSSAIDGVVIDYRYFGTQGTATAPYDLGRTTTHEVGHWLNLEHVWGDDNGACSGSDYVSDTPNQADYNYGCPSYPKKDNCTSSGDGIMYMNFLDYSDDDCMGMFSAGQATRMQSAINTSRTGLLTSKGCSGTTITTLTAAFSANSTSIYEGSSVVFTDQSTGNPTSWKWTFTGGNISSSTSQNPTVTYSTAGTYDVSLKVSDGNTNDTETKMAYITVLQASTTGCDTITNITTGSSVALPQADLGGYMSGHNGYKDEGIADYFSVYPNSSQLTAAMLGFGVAKYSTTSKKVAVKIWDNTGSNGEPGTVLATQNVKISSIATDVANNSLTLVTFTNPVTISTPFYLGIEFTYASGDTVAIYTNSDGETPVGTAWSKFSGGTWYPFSSSSNWNVNVSHYIYPIFCTGQTTSILNATDNISNLLLYPNPSSGKINVNLELRQSSEIEIVVYNILGNVVHSLKVENSQGGNYELDLASHSKGVYFVKVNTNKESIVEQLILSH